MAIDVEGKLQDINSQQQKRHKDKSLDEPPSRHSFGPVTESGSYSQRQDKKQDQQGIPDFDKVQSVFGSRIGDSLLIFLGRERIAFYGLLVGCRALPLFSY